MRLIGPFLQLLSMDGLSPAGPLADSSLCIYKDAGILIQGEAIIEVGDFQTLTKKAQEVMELPFKAVGLPGLIDAHTHICYAGSRASDYEKRLNGMTYQEIAAQGGGILDTVRQTRAASKEKLVQLMLARTARLLQIGITTCEVKSGYGLSVEEEVKMLEAIQDAGRRQAVRLIPTCLAAHTKPPEWENANAYLNEITAHLFPLLKAKNLSSRIDIFVEEGAFTVDEARAYLKRAQQEQFAICLHADQFSSGGSRLAAELGAASVDHLEQATPEDIHLLKAAGVIPVVLPGCSLGLGKPFAPARKILDQGLPLAIASDWNPGSAPMGNLLTQAALLGANQMLTMAEALAGITVRAAQALQLSDRGALKKGAKADLIVFDCSDYREILYQQGSLLPAMTWIGGKCEHSKA